MKKVLYLGLNEKMAEPSANESDIILHTAATTNEALLYLINGNYDLLFCDLKNGERNSAQFLQLVQNWKTNTFLVVSQNIANIDLDPQQLVSSPANKEDLLKISANFLNNQAVLS